MTLKYHEKQKHCLEGGLRCPYCGSTDIEGGPVEVHARLAEQKMSCVKCDKGWTDQYQLAVIVEDSE